MLASIAALLYSLLPASEHAYGEGEQEPLAENITQIEQGAASEQTTPEKAESLYERIADTAVTVRVASQGATRYASGAVIFSDGYIATLRSAVKDAEGIEVILKNGQ